MHTAFRHEKTSILNSIPTQPPQLSIHTVDGRNPAPAGMYKNLVNNGINYQSQHNLNWLAGFLQTFNTSLYLPSQGPRPTSRGNKPYFGVQLAHVLPHSNVRSDLVLSVPQIETMNPQDVRWMVFLVVLFRTSDMVENWSDSWSNRYILAVKLCGCNLCFWGRSW